MGGKILLAVQEVWRRSQDATGTNWRVRLITDMGVKLKGPTRATESGPQIGSKVAHWMNLELSGVALGLMSVR